VYAEIILETVTLDTPNNVADFITDASAKYAPMICPLSKSDKSPVFRVFDTNCHSTQSPMHSHEHYRVKTNIRKHTVLPAEVLTM
jgi:hypothetical protein